MSTRTIRPARMILYTLPVPPARAPGGRSHPEQRAQRRRTPAQPVRPRTGEPGRASVTRCQGPGFTHLSNGWRGSRPYETSRRDELSTTKSLTRSRSVTRARSVWAGSLSDHENRPAFRYKITDEPPELIKRRRSARVTGGLVPWHASTLAPAPYRRADPLTRTPRCPREGLRTSSYLRAESGRGSAFGTASFSQHRPWIRRTNSQPTGAARLSAGTRREGGSPRRQRGASCTTPRGRLARAGRLRSVGTLDADRGGCDPSRSPRDRSRDRPVGHVPEWIDKTSSWRMTPCHTHDASTTSASPSVTAFFVGLGLEVEGRMFVEGEFLDTDTVIGIPDSAPRSSCCGRPTGGTGWSCRASSGPTTSRDHRRDGQRAGAAQRGLRGRRPPGRRGPAGRGRLRAGRRHRRVRAHLAHGLRARTGGIIVSLAERIG